MSYVTWNANIADQHSLESQVAGFAHLWKSLSDDDDTAPRPDLFIDEQMSASGGVPFGLMMKAADFRNRHDVANRLLWL